MQTNPTPTMPETRITRLLNIKYPIIGAPMFLVSTPSLVAAVSNSGGIGTFPAMSYRTINDLKDAIKKIRALTQKPFGINIVLHKAHNPLWQEQFNVCKDEKVPLVITSMGTPRSIIAEARDFGIRVFCDVVNLRQARLLEKSGADAIIAVTAGAGGHAGRISPFALIPQLVENLKIPVIAAGSISSGRQMTAAFALGAEAVSVGTRFIATPESGATTEYRQALIDGDPDEVIYTPELTGVAANWLKVSVEKWKEMKMHPEWEQSGHHLKNWIDLWSAGHGIAQIDAILPVSEIIRNMIREYGEAKNGLP